MAVDQVNLKEASVARRPWLRLNQRQVLAYLMVAPAVIITLGIVFFPIAQTFWFSLHDIDRRFPDRGEPFIGLTNYTDLFTNKRLQPRLFDAFIFTTSFAVISVGLEFVLGLVVAQVLNRPWWGRGMLRAIVLIPWSLTTVVVARSWNLIYNAEYGVLNSILRNLGIIKDNLLFTASKDLTFWAVIGADVWKSTPFVALILLAGLQTINTEQYEAATVDGASGWQRFWHITLPGLRPTILVALLFRTIDASRIFDMVVVLTEGGFGTESLNLFTYKVLIGNQNFGLGSAIAVLTFIYIGIIAVIYVRVLGNREDKRA